MCASLKRHPLFQCSSQSRRVTKALEISITFEGVNKVQRDATEREIQTKKATRTIHELDKPKIDPRLQQNTTFKIS